MAAGTTILHKRKAGAFTSGQLAAGEFGVDITNGAVYFSVNGSTVQAISGGSGDSLVVLASNAVNNNAVPNTLQDITGLSFPVTAGQKYRFEAFIPYNAQATSTGSRWVINGPAGVYNYTSEYTLTVTTKTVNNLGAINLPAACNATSLTTGNIATIWGIIAPSATGVIQFRFASEVLNSAITALAGASVKFRQL